MTTGSRGVKERSGRAGWPTLMVAVVLLGLGGLAARPRPLPLRVPPLSMDLGAGLAEEASRRASLRGVVPEDATSRRLRDALLEQGRAEAAGGEPRGRATERLARIRDLAEALVEAHGEQALLALREDFLARYEALWAAQQRGQRPDPEQVAGQVGAFGRMLERYGLVRDGSLVAPRFVVRALYRARFHALVGRPLTWEMSRWERQAYYGWLAFHADAADPAMRLDALRAFATAAELPWPEAGHLDEAVAADARARDVLRARVALLASADRGEEALALGHAMLAVRPDLRLRNGLLALQQGLEARQRATRLPAPGSGNASKGSVPAP